MDTRQKWETIAARHPDQAARERAKQVLAEMGGGEDAGPSPRFDMRTNSVPAFDPMDAAIKRRAAREEQAKMTAGEAGIHGVAQGLSGGFADEIGSVAKTYGIGGFGSGGIPNFASVAEAANARQNAGDPSGMRTYRENVDASRAGLQQAAEHPLPYYGGMLLGGILAPSPKILGPGGKGVLPAAGRVATAGAKAAGEGAVYGVGQSEADDAAEVLRDAGKSAALGGALGVAGSTVGEGIKGAGNYIASNLKNRVLNEVGEGVSGKQITSTQRKHVNRAGDAIWEEMTTGPDADVVRGVRYQGATKGREALAPVLSRIGEEIGAEYDKFAAAGRNSMPAGPFLAKLEAAAAQALEEGDSLVADGIRAYASRVARAAEEKGGTLGLQQVRGLTTEAQSIASSAIDGLKGGANAQKLRAVATTAGETMDDALSDAARGDAALEEAATGIRAKNRRYSANKRIDEMLEMREPKENTAPGMLVQGVKGATNPITLGIGAAALSDDDDRIQNALGMAALGGAGRLAVPAARLAQRGITSAGIHAGLPGGWVGPAARGVGRATRPFVPPLSLSIMDALLKRREQEENGRR